MTMSPMELQDLSKSETREALLSLNDAWARSKSIIIADIPPRVILDE